tara:strand:+ start:695 stop:892 length:198 start_codon:yes stop_codon:yes gene_type:complete
MKTQWYVEKLTQRHIKKSGPGQASYYIDKAVWKRLRREYDTMAQAVKTHKPAHGVRYVQIVSEVE